MNKKVGDIDPVDALEISTRQIARQRVIGIDERRHSAHRAALGRDPVREFFVPMHPTPPAKDNSPDGEACRLSRRKTWSEITWEVPWYEIHSKILRFDNLFEPFNNLAWRSVDRLDDPLNVLTSLRRHINT